jgi:peroxiredoxin Q/BCP
MDTEDTHMTLNIGDKAPDFTLLSDQNVPVSLNDFHGKKVILYFYPKDNTPGCTLQACDFRDSLAQFSNQNTVVIGISKDSAERHQKFKQKYLLPFTLLADENGDVCEAYGIINKKSLFGRTFLGIQRSTFIIDETGNIRAIWRKVKVTGHSKQVLDELNR